MKRDRGIAFCMARNKGRLIRASVLWTLMPVVRAAPGLPCSSAYIASSVLSEISGLKYTTGRLGAGRPCAAPTARASERPAAARPSPRRVMPLVRSVIA